MRAVLEQLGTVLEVGPVGSGAAAKLVANATLFGVLAALGESVALGRALGLDEERLFEVLAATPLAAQAARRKAVLQGEPSPPRFPVRLAAKDARLILTGRLRRDRGGTARTRRRRRRGRLHGAAQRAQSSGSGASKLELIATARPRGASVGGIEHLDDVRGMLRGHAVRAVVPDRLREVESASAQSKPAYASRSSGTAS